MRSPRLTIILQILMSFLLVPMYAATRYVDGAAVGANNGTSWTDAWKSLSSMSGLAAGDTVYISGGPSGKTQTYNLAGEFSSQGGYRNGTVGSPITYKIGQDSAHNGTAIFNRISGGTQWLYDPHDVIFSGDAGDGGRHFKITNYTLAIMTNPVSNVRISYLDCGVIPRLCSINTGSGIEIDHCYAYGSNVGSYASLVLLKSSSPGNAYGQNSIHDNMLFVPYDNTSGSGYGTDGIVTSGHGIDIYNNTITGYFLAGATADHQDGWQSGGASYIRIYGNTFVNLVNYAIFAEPASAGYTHMRVYNNIVFQNIAQHTQGIAIAGSNTYPCTDVVCANNIAVGYNSSEPSFPFTFRNPGGPSYPLAFIGCCFYNNLVVGTGSNIIDANIASAGNGTISDATAVSYFASYTKGSSNNDYHLLSGATSVIGKGTSLASAFFTKDKDGLDRVAWDIGPYASSTSISSLPAPGNARVTAVP